MVAHSSRSPLTQNSIAGEQRKTLMSTERKTISEKRYLAAPQEGVMETYQEKSNQGKGGSSYHPFQERVDRHGNAFGERISTKQTRNPPPETNTITLDNSNLTWRQKAAQEKEDIGMDPYYSDISPRTEAALLNKRKENAARIRSLIVSASMEPRVSRGLSQRPPAKPQAEEEKEETLQEFQNKVRRGTSRSSKRRSPRSSPNVLLGASLKKRRLSQIQNSPNRGKTGGESSARGAKKNGKAPVISGKWRFVPNLEQ
ncbi:hypothetical protein F2Q69_00010735 [Brassica cretica]|uniref:Uncharacterized protein n=2 Tax=Brassica cretica TaxID=69181 RepID=A0ABQ7DDP0_BRACR|nr:hypothetical protein F2Q69_00010735 [Brassica cretica]KAF3575556.1 hypothetical protein DY000_02028773 [Brassica cretica]